MPAMQLSCNWPLRSLLPRNEQNHDAERWIGTVWVFAVVVVVAHRVASAAAAVGVAANAAAVLAVSLTNDTRADATRFTRTYGVFV